MALLTDLLSANTTDIASNATAAASAGGMTLLSSASPSNVTTTSLTLPSGYYSFLLIFDRFIPTDNANFHTLIKGASSPNWMYAGRSTHHQGSNLYTSNSTGTGSGMTLNVGGTIASSNTDSNYTGWSGSMQIYGAKESGYTYTTYQGAFVNDAGRFFRVSGAGRSNTSQVDTTVDVKFNTNTLSGNIKLYGIKQ